MFIIITNSSKSLIIYKNRCSFSVVKGLTSKVLHIFIFVFLHCLQFWNQFVVKSICVYIFFWFHHDFGHTEFDVRNFLCLNLCEDRNNFLIDQILVHVRHDSCKRLEATNSIIVAYFVLIVYSNYLINVLRNNPFFTEGFSKQFTLLDTCHSDTGILLLKVSHEACLENLSEEFFFEENTQFCVNFKHSLFDSPVGFLFPFWFV